MTLESTIREGVELLRARGHEVTYVTDAAVVDGVPEEAGHLPENPDTGAGSEPGSLVVNVDGKPYGEAWFTGLQTAQAVVIAVEKDLA